MVGLGRRELSAGARHRDQADYRAPPETRLQPIQQEFSSLPAPPPDVPELPDRAADADLSVRELTERQLATAPVITATLPAKSCMEFPN